MSWYAYSTESVPNFELAKKQGFRIAYNPEYIQWHGATLPTIPAKEWMELPESFDVVFHKDWTDKQGEVRTVTTHRIIKAVAKRDGIADRGIIFLDHQPDDKEKSALETISAEANEKFRKRAIDEFETQLRDRAITGVGRTAPTPYEDECYDLLGVTKPYSVEAIRAQRHPGEAVGEQIVSALKRLEAERKAEAVAAPLPEPEPVKQPEGKGFFKK